MLMHLVRAFRKFLKNRAQAKRFLFKSFFFFINKQIILQKHFPQLARLF